MNAALLYQPSPQWRIWSALAAAALLHLGAVGLAGLQPKENALIAPKDSGLDLDFYPDETTPSDPEDELPPPLPPLASEPDFPEDVATPPPVRRTVDKAPSRVVRPPANRNPYGKGGARLQALSAPHPEYPYEARRQRLTGSGLAAFTIDSASGSVLNVSMVRGTGSAILDNAAIVAFRRWRFRPGTPAQVQSPITYTLTGASY